MARRRDTLAVDWIAQLMAEASREEKQSEPDVLHVANPS